VQYVLLFLYAVWLIACFYCDRLFILSLPIFGWRAYLILKQVIVLLLIDCVFLRALRSYLCILLSLLRLFLTISFILLTIYLDLKVTNIINIFHFRLISRIGNYITSRFKLHLFFAIVLTCWCRIVDLILWSILIFICGLLKNLCVRFWSEDSLTVLFW